MGDLRWATPCTEWRDDVSLYSVNLLVSRTIRFRLSLFPLMGLCMPACMYVLYDNVRTSSMIQYVITATH